MKSPKKFHLLIVLVFIMALSVEPARVSNAEAHKSVKPASVDGMSRLGNMATRLENSAIRLEQTACPAKH